MPGLTAFAKRCVRRAGFTITRARPLNRFDAMRDALAGLARRGFAPTLIIDAGANVGDWARMATEVFSPVPLHAIEPQPACAAMLDAFARTHGAMTVHRLAITAPGCRRVAMVAARAGSSGAWVTDRPAEAGTVTWMPASTLDDVMAGRLGAGDRILLKLDLEGHELAALAGAARVLSAVEVVVSETAFFDINGSGYPILRDLVAMLDRHGFDLYDIASLASRPRDDRLRLGDAIFVRRESALAADHSWE